MRRNLLISGLVLTGIDLYGFYLPILGKSIGLSSTANAQQVVAGPGTKANAP